MDEAPTNAKIIIFQKKLIMAEEIKRVIEVDASASVQTVRELQAEVDKLRTQLSQLNTGTAQYTKAQQKAAAAEKQLNDAMSITEDSNATRLATAKELAETEARDAERINKIIDALAAYRDAGHDISESLQGMNNATEQATRTTHQLDESVIKLQDSAAELIESLMQDQKELAAVQAQRKELDKEIRQGLITEQQATEVKGELLAQETVYKTRIAETRQELKAVSKEVVAANGSYNQMSQTLGRLRDQYRQMGEAERNSASGKELLTHIQGLDTELKQLDASMGNHQRNVGNYPGLMGQFSGALEKAGVPVDKMMGLVGKLSGVVVGAIATFKSFKAVIESTQTTGDAMRTDVAGWSAAFDVFKKAVADVDFTNLLYRMAEASEAGRVLAQVLDSVFERGNSISIRRAELTKENAVLLATLRDTTATYADRQAAGQKYLENQKELAQEEIDLNKDVRDAQLDNLFALTNKRKFASKEAKEAAKQEFAANIKNYNLNNEVIGQINELINKEKEVADTQRRLIIGGASEEIIDKYIADSAVKTQALQKNIEKVAEKAKVSAKDLTDFVKQYNLTNDAQVDAYVKAEVAYQESLGAFETETIRSGNMVKSVTKSMSDEAKKAADEQAKAAKDAADATEKVLRDTLKIQQDMRAETEANEVQTARENYAQELADFNKTVEEKGITEEAAAGYRKALAEKTEADIAEIRKKYRDKEAEELAKVWDEEQKREQERTNMKLDALNRSMGDADRQAQRETAEAQRDITDPEALEQELQDIQQRLYESKIALIDEMLKDETLDFDTITKLSNQRADLEIKNIERVSAAERKAAEEKKKIADLDKQRQKQALAATASFLNSTAELVGKETKAGKALAVSSALISTFLSAQQAYQSAFMPVPTAASPILGAISAAAALATGLGNVKNILSVDEKGETSAPSASSVTPGVPAVVTPPAVVQQVPLTRTLTSATEEERLNQMASPQKVYVVYSDIEGAGRQVDVVQHESTF